MSEQNPNTLTQNIPTTSGGTRSKDSAIFGQCLKQYAAAALGVAGAGVLAAAQTPAAHHFQYTAADIPLTEPGNTTVPIDFNHDGVTDITLSATGTSMQFSGHGGQAYGAIFETPPAGNFAIGGRAINFGVPIDRGGAFQSSKQRLAWAFNRVLATSSYHRTSSGGPFKNVTNKYLGVRFLIAGHVHEGWIRLSISCSKFGVVSGTITGYAYDTVPDELGVIAAGKFMGPVVKEASIEKAAPGSLGMLALGSPAIRYWRK